MDARTRDLSSSSRLLRGSETTRFPNSPPSDPDDELFHEVFDWNGYCKSTQPYLAYSTAAYPPSPESSSPSYFHTSFVDEGSSELNEFYLDQLQNDFSNMSAHFRTDESSDYSGHSPPDLTQGDSSSPSAYSASNSVILDHYDEAGSPVYPGLRDVQAQDDEWTYPQADPSYKAGIRVYPHNLQVAEDHSRSAGVKRRRSKDEMQKRARHLTDPTQTAVVRKSGACLPCRVSKTRCHDNGVCPTCRKAFPEHSHLACSRLTPLMVYPVIGTAPDVWSRNAMEEQELCTGPQFYTGKPRDIQIFFTSDASMPALPATVQAYRSSDMPDDSGVVRKADFPRDRVPSHETLQRWAEANLCKEKRSDPQYRLQKLLYAYVEQGRGLPKHGLVTKVHKMSCFFRIWRCSSFWCRDPSNKIVALPLSVQAQLRKIARKALNSLEHDVFKELDECVARQDTPKTEEKLAMWASMWQLLFMYRDLFSAFKVYIRRAAAAGFDQATMLEIEHLDQRYCSVIFPLLAIFYHYQFRTKKSVELSLDWLKTGSFSRYDTHSIRKNAQKLLDDRRDMYHAIQKGSSSNELDHLLCYFVVDHEVKKLNTRSRTTKSSSKSSKSSKSKRSTEDYDED